MVTSSSVSTSWNGAFAPSVKKSIGRVRFVPLAEMTARDWDWLDYDRIRTVAQNRIAAAIMRGQLKGFFQVMITEKAAKNEYFWPATPADIQEFAEGGSAEFFRHAPEVDSSSAAVEGLERLRAGITFLPLSVIMLLATAASGLVSEDDRSQVNSLTEERLGEISQADIELLMSAILMWAFSLEEAESLLDDLPESDEADEVRDWINDRVAEIEASRRQLAAGRGLTDSFSL